MKSWDQREHVRGGVRYIEPNASSGQDETVISERAWVRVLMWTGLPLLGVGAGWLLKAITNWVVSLPWAPLQGPFQLADRIIASFGEPQATVGAVAVGTLAGLVLAFIAEHESLKVTVSPGRITASRGEYLRIVERPFVGAAFLDGKQLVVLGHETEELIREPSDLDADRLRSAFVAHGYPWLAGGDPYRDEYRLWVEDTPDLPAGANALLKARARALGKDDGKEDAAELRAELVKLGIVVREEKKRQYWRRVRERRAE